MRNCSLLLIATLCSGSCAIHREPTVKPPGVVRQQPLVLNGHALTIHMADARLPADDPRPLLIYATGDRGWAGKDLDVYRHLVSWGYPAAGFDAHDYVKHLGSTTTTTPGRLARDYQAIIEMARKGLGLPVTVPVVLVGVSRGADLSVVAAGQRLLRDRLAGVVVMGLTREEEYVWYRRFHRHTTGSAPAKMVELYAYLPQLGPVPITVIQSTRDNYLPAAAARDLFGPDAPGHHFVAIDARNHSFAGARDKLYAALHDALASTPSMHP